MSRINKKLGVLYARVNGLVEPVVVLDIADIDQQLLFLKHCFLTGGVRCIPVDGYELVVPYDIYSHWYDTIFLPSLNEPQP